ncbi:hypothetical protein K2X33_03290 [bacterium]|nr:hypothetical protein [bacterium]
MQSRLVFLLVTLIAAGCAQTFPRLQGGQTPGIGSGPGASGWAANLPQLQQRCNSQLGTSEVGYSLNPGQIQNFCYCAYYIISMDNSWESFQSNPHAAIENSQWGLTECDFGSEDPVFLAQNMGF